MHSNKERLSIGWCDNGMVDGKFAEGIVYTTLLAPSAGVPVVNAVRVQGNQIGRQRQALFDMWYDNIKTEWLLWVDSDIVLDEKILKMLWDVADKHTHPVVCGVYFISKQNESPVMQPMPAVFNDISEFQIQYLHPLPENQVVEIDNAGLGLCLMHKSVVEKLREMFPNQSVFAEQEGIGEQYVSEDIVFFRKLKLAGVKVHAHTGALVKHMKRFALDVNYYKMWWNYATMLEQQKESPE